MFSSPWAIITAVLVILAISYYFYRRQNKLAAIGILIMSSLLIPPSGWGLILFMLGYGVGILVFSAGMMKSIFQEAQRLNEERRKKLIQDIADEITKRQDDKK